MNWLINVVPNVENRRTTVNTETTTPNLLCRSTVSIFRAHSNHVSVLCWSFQSCRIKVTEEKNQKIYIQRIFFGTCFTTDQKKIIDVIQTDCHESKYEIYKMIFLQVLTAFSCKFTKSSLLRQGLRARGRQIKTDDVDLRKENATACGSKSLINRDQIEGKRG